MNKKGFTLIEVLVGLVILAVGLLAIAGMQITSVKGNRFSGAVTQASILAQDRLETLRNLPFGHADLSVGVHDDGVLPGTIFRRSYTVAVVPGTSMLQITVTVSWNETTDHAVSFTTVRAQ